MPDVGIKLLTKDEIAALKEHAVLTMRSAKRRPVCHCERPLPDAGSCVKCGRSRSRPTDTAHLMRAVRELDRLIRPVRTCWACGDDLTYVETNGGMGAFYWCDLCGRESTPCN